MFLGFPNSASPLEISASYAVKQEEARKAQMEAAKTAVPKTPPESDPRKEYQNIPGANEISVGPEEFEDIRPKDNGKPQTINKEIPDLAGN